MKHLILCALIGLLNFACSSGARNAESAVTPEQTQARLGIGLQALESGHYQEAHNFFEDFVQKNPVTRFTSQALYYDGVAQNELGAFEDAANKLQTVVRLNEDKDLYLEADALYNLGKSHEGMGNDEKALATLLDAERRSKFLSHQVADVEIPARVAGIYARQGQMELADRYYTKAENGLAKLKGKGSFEKQDWIPKALYGMGKITPRQISESDFESGLRSLRRSQSYLLRATEFNHALWSPKAEVEIEEIYKNAWSVIEAYPLADSEDKLAALKEQQNRMIELGLILSGVLSQLNQEFLPDQETVNPSVKKLKAFVAQFDKKIDALIGSRPMNEGLTPEAEKLDAVVREGKVVDPNATLEKNKSSKKKEKE